MKNLITLLSLLIFSTITLTAQNTPCGLKVDPNAAKLMDGADSNFKNRLSTFKMSDYKSQINGNNEISIVAHVIRKSNGTGGTTEAKILEGLGRVNSDYQDMNMEFMLCDVRYIDNDNYYSTVYDFRDESIIARNNNVNNVINVYFVPNSTGSWAYYPFMSEDWMVMNNFQLEDRSTFSHEFGHYFGLYHTHDTPFCHEATNGSNCATCGDLICDTPADPNLYDKVNFNCMYIGDNSYNPDVKNIMSYAPAQCKTRFSNQQKMRIVFTFLNQRNYLLDAGCNNKNINSYYTCNDGGHYYVRQIGDEVYWFGEHPNGTWANVFKGELDGNRITGYFYDIPKGHATGGSELKLEVINGGGNIRKISGSSFGGTIFTKDRRPNRLPGSRVEAYSQAGNIGNLDGLWNCNDGGRYYVRQIGEKIIWFGEGDLSYYGIPRFANVAVGTRNGNNITVDWADIPKCDIKGKGQLTLRINNANEIVKTGGAGFGGSKWNRSGTNINLNSYYNCNDRGYYYIRQIGNDVYWFGEHPDGKWANVFKGKLRGTELTGHFYDVPKGRASGGSELKLRVSIGGNNIQKISGSSFGGTTFTRAHRPSRLPGNRGAGYSQTGNIGNMNGLWNCDDGGRYYVRQIGQKIIWFGEGGLNSKGIPHFANVAIGTRNENTIRVDWVDIPKSGLNGKGQLTLRINNANEIIKTGGSGFGGSKWRR